MEYRCKQIVSFVKANLKIDLRKLSDNDLEYYEDFCSCCQRDAKDEILRRKGYDL